jgi:hypothetical protein
MRTVLWLLILAAMIGGASCSGDGDYSPPQPDAGCGGAGPNGPVDGGSVEYDVNAPWSEGNPGLPYCAALSSLFANGRSHLVFDHGPADSREVTLWLSPDGNEFTYKDTRKFPPERSIGPRPCDFVVSRHDATGAEGTFSCTDTNLDVAGSFVVNVRPGSSAQAAPPSLAPPVATPSHPSSSAGLIDGQCGRSSPSGASGSVQFNVTGAQTESGTLPFCSYFSSFSDDESFLVFTSNADATEPDGVIISLGPDRNELQFFPPLIDVPLQLGGCDVTLSRDDASGLTGTFSCDDTSASGIKVIGSFVVDR